MVAALDDDWVGSLHKPLGALRGRFERHPSKLGRFLNRSKWKWRPARRCFLVSRRLSFGHPMTDLLVCSAGPPFATRAGGRRFNMFRLIAIIPTSCTTFLRVTLHIVIDDTKRGCGQLRSQGPGLRDHVPLRQGGHTRPRTPTTTAAMSSPCVKPIRM